MVKRYGYKRALKGGGSAAADAGLRKVTFVKMKSYHKFVEFMWMRVPDNRRRLVPESARVELYDNPNAQVVKMAKGLGGTWS